MSGRMKDHIGIKYSRLTVIELSHKEGPRYYWKCKCDCGNETTISARDLKRTHSCGCFKTEISKSPERTQKIQKSHERAGKRKCRRCKKIWNKPKGRSLICDQCKTECYRCSVVLTEENKAKTTSKVNQYVCKPCKVAISKLTKNTDRQREWRLLKQYGITVDEYEKILELQQGVCFICGNPPTGNALAIDHKHVLRDKQQNPRDTRTRVRGLLCWQCNGALGKFKDDPVRLRKAADYLEKWPAQEILKGTTDGSTL